MKLARTLISTFYFLTALTGHAEKKVSYNFDVKPILSDRCYKCHGPDAENQKSEFRLDTEEHAWEDLGGYAGIVPGNLKESEVHLRLHTNDPDELMPPPESNLALTAEEKEIIDTWIKQGAKFEKHWSFIPVPEEIPVPQTSSDWAKNEIDHFIAEGFEKASLTPATESPREKWLRRVSFDLTGLPPTLEELDTFLNDQSENSYEKVVDRLLKSPAYAERMTAEWLDVARYSDSYGYQRDSERRVWPWRDWVLRSFQENKSYAQFITEQIAGDLIPNATEDQKLATAFNRLHGHCMEGGSVLEEYRCEYVADRIETVSVAFLGLTMQCAKCHDHKYDPLPTKDYYALSSFFANIDESGLISYFTDAVPTPAMPLPSEAQKAALAHSEITLKKAITTHQNTLIETENDFQSWLDQRPSQAHLPDLEAHLSFETMDPEGKLENAAPGKGTAQTKTANKIVPGRHGNAILFTGDDETDLHDVGHHPRSKAFSTSFWLKTNEIVPRANIYSRGGGADDAASMGYECLLMDGKVTASLIHFWPGNGLRIQTKQALEKDRWHHLSITYDGSSSAVGLKIYLDGKLAPTTVIKDTLTRTITDWRGDHLTKRQFIAIGQRYRDRGLKGGLLDEFKLFARQLSAAEVAHLHDETSLTVLLQKPKTELEEHELAALREYYQFAISPAAKASQNELEQARLAQNKIIDEIPAISVMEELETPRPAYILERGAYDSHGEEVTADTPTALPPMDPSLKKDRFGLAKWLTAPENPLPSRVVVNRYWQMIFGRGIVATSEDFGSQGTRPSHPELLDWLARDFMKHNWDLHHLLKQMVLSATYRQSTETTLAAREKDPENFYLARSHATRLSAEMIRDNALASSGLLVKKLGGPTVKPYEVKVSFTPTDPDKGEGLYRRSVYTWWKRNSAAPVMTTFGVPKRDVCTVKREVTTSPLQSLILLNDPQFLEAARMLAEKLIQKYEKNTNSLIQEAYRTLTSRFPEKQELSILEKLYAAQFSEFEATPSLAESLLKVGDSPTQETLPPARLAATTVLVNAIMNLDESLTER